TAPIDAEVANWANSPLGAWAIEVAFESSYEFVYNRGLSPALGERIRVGTLGDSLTDAYAKYTKDPNAWGSAGDRNWVEQLSAARGTSVLITNEALAGTTSSSLLQQSVSSTTQGQDAQLSTLVHHGLVDSGVLIIGAND